MLPSLTLWILSIPPAFLSGVLVGLLDSLLPLGQVGFWLASLRG